MQVRWFAGAADAAGVEQEDVQLDATGSIREVLAAHRPQAHEVLERCSFLADGRSLRGDDAWPGDATTLDVLPPFVGG